MVKTRWFVTFLVICIILVCFLSGCAVITKERAAPLSRKTFTNSLGMKFIYVPPGTFLMGTPADERGAGKDEKQHQVTISRAFYLQTTEVTQGQWNMVMGNNPSFFKECGNNCPVEEVSWNDVREFIKRLNQMMGTGEYRLPTEAEWEYACRAGAKTPFNTGPCLSTEEANYQGNFPYFGCPPGQYQFETVKTGSYLPNSWGLYDMHGNVSEWCQDWKGEYPAGHVTDPEGPPLGRYRVIRGGSWGREASACRSAKRHHCPPESRSNRIGFRLARTP